jgi:hypothetical protein
MTTYTPIDMPCPHTPECHACQTRKTVEDAQMDYELGYCDEATIIAALDAHFAVVLGEQ